jgi:antitoxin FitA
MPVAITIRNVPNEVRNELAARAAAHGWSLQEFLLNELVELSRRPDRRALVAHIERGLDGTRLTAGDLVRAARADRH